MTTVKVSTKGDDADITLAIGADGYLPLRLNLSFRDKLRACWGILLSRELRIWGPLECTLKGKVGTPPKLPETTQDLGIRHICEHGVVPETNCRICFS